MSPSRLWWQTTRRLSSLAFSWERTTVCPSCWTLRHVFCHKRVQCCHWCWSILSFSGLRLRLLSSKRRGLQARHSSPHGPAHHGAERHRPQSRLRHATLSHSYSNPDDRRRQEPLWARGEDVLLRRGIQIQIPPARVVPVRGRARERFQSPPNSLMKFFCLADMASPTACSRRLMTASYKSVHVCPSSTRWRMTTFPECARASASSAWTTSSEI